MPSKETRGTAVSKCPFCGNEKLREGQGDMYFIECEPCYDNFGTTVSAEGNARHDAVAMWNRRSALAAPAATETAVGELLLPFLDEMSKHANWCRKNVSDAANCTCPAEAAQHEAVAIRAWIAELLRARSALAAGRSHTTTPDEISNLIEQMSRDVDEFGGDRIAGEPLARIRVTTYNALAKARSALVRVGGLSVRHVLNVADGLEEYGGVMARGDDALRDLLTSAERILREIVEHAGQQPVEQVGGKCETAPPWLIDSLEGLACPHDTPELSDGDRHVIRAAIKLLTGQQPRPADIDELVGDFRGVMADAREADAEQPRPDDAEVQQMTRAPLFIEGVSDQGNPADASKSVAKRIAAQKGEPYPFAGESPADAEGAKCTCGVGVRPPRPHDRSCPMSTPPAQSDEVREADAKALQMGADALEDYADHYGKKRGGAAYAAQYNDWAKRLRRLAARAEQT